jgi:hypothetical protein
MPGSDALSDGVADALIEIAVGTRRSRRSAFAHLAELVALLARKMKTRRLRCAQVPQTQA